MGKHIESLLTLNLACVLPEKGPDAAEPFGKLPPFLGPVPNHGQLRYSKRLVMLRQPLKKRLLGLELLCVALRLLDPFLLPVLAENPLRLQILPADQGVDRPGVKGVLGVPFPEADALPPGADGVEVVRQGLLLLDQPDVA